MQAVISNATSRALYLFADNEAVVITDRGMVSPLKAADIKAQTHSVVTVAQPDMWVAGALAYDSGQLVVADQAAVDEAMTAATLERLGRSASSTLDEAKARAHQRRIEALKAAEDAGFTHDGHSFDSDQRSREKIGQAVTGAMLAQQLSMTDAEFAAMISGGWRNTNGTIVVTTIDGMIALGLALGNHMGSCDAVSQGHKTAINALTTIAEADIYDATTGY